MLRIHVTLAEAALIYEALDFTSEMYEGALEAEEGEDLEKTIKSIASMRDLKERMQ